MHLHNQVEATKEQFKKLMTDYPKGEPVTMVNILKYKEKSGVNDESGQTTYQRYAKNVFPLLQKVGGKLIWMGKVNHTIVGDTTVEPDMIMIVEYPSVDNFISMAISDEYRAIAGDRINALEYGALLASKTLSK